jgi:hypothetical protein
LILSRIVTVAEQSQDGFGARATIGRIFERVRNREGLAAVFLWQTKKAAVLRPVTI